MWLWAFASAMLRGYSGLAQVGCLAGILCFLSRCESTTAVGFCPSCQGNAPSCTYATDGRCPVADTITANAGVIAGTAAAGTTLILSNVVPARWLKVLNRHSTEHVTSLVSRPAPGTIFQVAADTGIDAIYTALSQSRTTFESCVPPKIAPP